MTNRSGSILKSAGHMMPLGPLALLLAMAACGIRPADPVDSPPAGLAGAHAVEARVAELSGKDLWPGFDPLAVPLAIHDGSHTWLFRHPSPPEGFQPMDGAHRWDGRHPAVTANTSTEIGGIETAVLMASTLQGSLEGAAGIAIHEAFHAFQKEHHPTWAADEMQFFVYPITDPELLGLRRLESEALRRALGSDHQTEAACWAALAMELRHERFQKMPPGAAAYERGNELNEGLARYVEYRAVPPARPPSRFPDLAPEELRLRAYPVGAALALLLDRSSPGWRHSLEINDSHTLDRLLAMALPRPDRRGTCGFQADERARIEAVASADAATVERGRAEAREDFMAAPGWRLIIDATEAPFSARFDPHNLQVVGAGEILHTRIVLLSGPGGSVEVIDGSALTIGAGEHPLIDGVGGLMMTGLTERPVVEASDGAIQVTAGGLSAVLRRADVVVDGKELRIRLAGTAPKVPQ
jgi:hypothetical protein